MDRCRKDPGQWIHSARCKAEFKRGGFNPEKGWPNCQGCGNRTPTADGSTYWIEISTGRRLGSCCHPYHDGWDPWTAAEGLFDKVQTDFQPPSQPQSQPQPQVWVYAIQGVAGGPTKIGQAREPESRLATLQTGSPTKLQIVGRWLAVPANLERLLHHFFAQSRVNGEWFNLGENPVPRIERAIRDLQGKKAPKPSQVLELTDDNPLRLCWDIHCPTCGEQTMDRVGHGGDHTAVTVYPDRDAYDSPIGTRGGYLRVELCCPAGHYHALILANHKGDEVLALIPSQEQDKP